MINRLMNKFITISNDKMLTFANCSILFGLTMIPFNISQIKFIENTLYRYMIIGIIYVLGLIIMTLANIKIKLKNKNK